MNKDYLEYQYSKSKKLTERAFKLRIGMLAVSILACAGIMASSAFALFTCDINRTTTLTAGVFSANALSVASSGGDTQTYELVGPPGIEGYCIITVWDKYGAPTIYYTKPFIGSMQVTITRAAESSLQLNSHWGNPRNYGITAPLIGDGGSIMHSTTPDPEAEAAITEASSGGGGQDVSQEQQDNETDNTPTENATENNDEVLETPMLSVSPSVNKEQTTVTESAVTEKEITSVVEKSETTVTSSVSEEKTVENNSTVTEAPVTSTPLSDNNSDSGTSDSSANSSDSGTSSGSVSSGSDASPAVTSSSSSDGGGE